MKTNKKPKHTISLRHIIIFMFTLSLLVAFATQTVLLYNHNYDAKYSDCESLSHYATKASTAIIDKHLDTDSLYQRLAEIKTDYDLNYLYVASIVEESDNQQITNNVINDDGSWNVIVTDSTSNNHDIIYEHLYKVLYEGSKEETVMSNNNYGYVVTVFMPIYDKNNEVYAAIAADTYAGDIINDAIKATAIQLILIAISLLFVIILLAFLLEFIMTRPVKSLAKNMSNFVQNKSDNNLKMQRISRHITELSVIEKSYDKMKADISKYIDEVKTSATEKAKYTQQLDMAAKIQKGCLQTAFPQSEHIKIAAGMRAAKEVGGDFYSCEYLENSVLYAVIGDVSDKGVPAALMMMKAQGLFQILEKAGIEPDKMATRINEEISINNPNSMFLTAFIYKFDLQKNTLTYVNAGHNSPVIVYKDGRTELAQCRHSLVMGAEEEMKYRQTELSLDGIESIILYTDGITEAFNARGEMFGNDRLIEYINNSRNKSIDDVVNGMYTTIDEFSKGIEQSDDITMLAVTFCD